MLINKDKLFVGAASLAAGYVGASLLGGIAHHAAAPSGKTCNGIPCEHLNCDQASSQACVVACGQGVVDAFNKNCANKPLAPLSTSFGGGPSAAAQQKAAASNTTPNPDPDADCNGWGFFKPICVAGKSFTKGSQSASQFLTSPCISGIPIPCALLGFGAGIIILLTLKGR